MIASPMVDRTDRTLISEEDVRNLPFGTVVRISERALVTPLAADIARERHVLFERIADKAHSPRVAIGADHGGFEMKQALRGFLEHRGIKYVDVGTHSPDPVDYPDFAEAVARAVSLRKCDLGIMIDGAGIGSCMVANKIPGVRAAMCYDEASARNSREHNGANVLTLGGKMISVEQMRNIVRVWLGSELSEERHRRRVAKIDALL
jgi:ribose 5-phosphate isomerase B